VRGALAAKAFFRCPPSPGAMATIAPGEGGHREDQNTAQAMRAPPPPSAAGWSE
jgi:hypothetical protein